MALSFHWILFIPLALLIYSSPSPIKGIALLLSFFLFVKLTHPEQQKLGEKGEFVISSLKIQQSPFQKSLLYTGTFNKIPCKIYAPLNKKYYPADKKYIIEGKMDEKSSVLKPHKKKSWQPIENTFSFAQWRFEAKQAVRHYIKKHLKNPKVASFMSTLATGDIDERSLAFEFGRLGLQHILAISGFHFGMLALFAGFIFRLVFPLKIAAIALLLLLTSYYFFLGNSPSIQRAWIACSIFLIGYIANKRCTALNALGLGLMIELILDPLSLLQISFQLSFAATMSLLLLYQPMHSLISRMIPKKPLSVLSRMSMLDQHGYLLSAFFRKTLALNLSVHLFTLPLILFLFHKFPLLSLVYNLFFPLAVTISFFLFLLSLLLPFLHTLNEYYTSALLQMTSNPPALLNYSFRIKIISFPLIVALLTLIFYAGTQFSAKKDLNS